MDDLQIRNMNEAIEVIKDLSRRVKALEDKQNG